MGVGGRVVVACRVVRDEGGAGYGQFGVLSRGELERFFYLDDEDRRLYLTYPGDTHSFL